MRWLKYSYKGNVSSHVTTKLKPEHRKSSFKNSPYAFLLPLEKEAIKQVLLKSACSSLEAVSKIKSSHKQVSSGRISEKKFTPDTLLECRKLLTTKHWHDSTCL